LEAALDKNAGILLLGKGTQRIMADPYRRPLDLTE